MGHKALSERENWQAETLVKATEFELDFYNVMDTFFKKTNQPYRIRKKPSEFQNIYKNYELSADTISEIYNPTDKIKKHGIAPDFAIDNLITSKTIYGDNKRQDGWIEGGTRHDGRGNAHERMCKYFTPGLLKKLRLKGNITSDHLPFWIVLRGNITRDPCRVREITSWFEDNPQNVFFWRNQHDNIKLITHFEKMIKPILQ